MAVTGGMALLLSACAGQGGSGATDPAGGSPAATNGSASCEITFDDSGALQPLADGFPSEPITILVADSPGSSDDIWARSMQNAVEDISPVRVEVDNREDFTAFGTWEALLEMGNSEEGNEGYINLVHTTPGDVTDHHMLPIEEETGLSIDDRNSVIGLDQSPYMIVQRGDAPWGDTWEEMVAYAHENPGELRYISREVGSSLDLAMEYYMDAFDIEAEKIIGGPQPEIAAILGAGEGDISMMTPSNILPHWEADRLDVIAVMADESPEPWDDAPAVTELADVIPWASTRGLSVTSEVPDCHRDWLYELWKAGSETDEFQTANAEIPGRIPILWDHEQMMEFAHETFERTEPIVRDLGLHWDQQ